MTPIMRVVLPIVGALIGWNLASPLAQGHGPFLLAYGNAEAIRAEADLSQIPTTLQISPATVGSRQVLGGSTRLVGKPGVFPWMRAVLWGVLLMGVALLAWMAYRLANEPVR